MVDAKVQHANDAGRSQTGRFHGLGIGSKRTGLSVRSVPLLLREALPHQQSDGLLTSAKTLDANLNAEFTQKQLMGMFFDYFRIHTVYRVGAPLRRTQRPNHMFLTMVAKDLAIIGEIDPAVDPENSPSRRKRRIRSLAQHFVRSDLK